MWNNVQKHPWLKNIYEAFDKINDSYKASRLTSKKPASDESESSSSFHFHKPTLLHSIIFGLMGTATLVGLIGIGYITSVVLNAPKLEASDFVEQDSSKVYDAQGNLVADIGVQIRENIDFEDLPQITIDAFVSVEDSRFFEHNGFDLPRFTKAMLENIRTLSFGQGGSTFTMQLVKGTYFETEDSLAARSGLDGINRKIQEISLALQAETIIDKQRILEMYLNRINFGVPQNRRGIQTAAQYYFGKDVTDLNLLESAMLAGVINAPYPYSPMRNLDLATSRTHTVLDLMVYHGYITQEEANLAKSIPLENLIVGELKQEATDTNVNPNQAYVDAVIAEVKDLTGKDPALESMKIYTAMDSSLQAHIESIENGYDKTVVWPNDVIQTAILTMNNQTGEIVAIGGGRDYTGERLFNRAVDMKRQPGSSAKLILTYPLAFEYLGWSTQHILQDRPIIYAGTDVVIKNFDDNYRGDVSIAYAIGNSLNIPAIETMAAVDNEVGPDVIIDYLNSIGFPEVNKSNFDLGYGIGGSLFKASPLQMAGAYSAMINEGLYIKPHTITKIEFSDGSEPYVATFSEKSVLSKEAAYISTAMMEQDVSGPYRNFMQILQRSYPVYAKTGTSDWGDTGIEFGIPSGSAKDKWMIASTSQYTTAVWVGYDQAVKDQISYLDQAQINLNLPGKINSSILNAMYASKTKPTAIVRPETVVDLTHVKGVYPYASVTESTPADWIVTGLVKEEFANLVTLTSPVAMTADFSVANGQVLTGNVRGYDPSGYTYYTVVDYPAHGMLEFDGASGTFTYTHSGDKAPDQFTFKASYSEPAVATINLLPEPKVETQP